MNESVLAGLRVIELAQGVYGPCRDKLLAGLGAEVIKVEPPASPQAKLSPLPTSPATST